MGENSIKVLLGINFCPELWHLYPGLCISFYTLAQKNDILSVQKHYFTSYRVKVMEIRFWSNILFLSKCSRFLCTTDCFLFQNCCFL